MGLSYKRVTPQRVGPFFRCLHSLHQQVSLQDLIVLFCYTTRYTLGIFDRAVVTSILECSESAHSGALNVIELSGVQVRRVWGSNRCGRLTTASGMKFVESESRGMICFCRISEEFRQFIYCDDLCKIIL